jgi:hypothetical protein
VIVLYAQKLSNFFSEFNISIFMLSNLSFERTCTAVVSLSVPVFPVARLLRVWCDMITLGRATRDLDEPLLPTQPATSIPLQRRRRRPAFPFQPPRGLAVLRQSLFSGIRDLYLFQLGPVCIKYTITPYIGSHLLVMIQYLHFNP